MTISTTRLGLRMRPRRRFLAGRTGRLVLGLYLTAWPLLAACGAVAQPAAQPAAQPVATAAPVSHIAASDAMSATMVMAPKTPDPTKPVQPPESSITGPKVTIDNFSFTPRVIMVPVGSTVTWINHDDVPHTVTAADKSYSSKGLDTDDRYTHQFTVAGVYSYFCSIHSVMTGTVVVQ